MHGRNLSAPEYSFAGEALRICDMAELRARTYELIAPLGMTAARSIAVPEDHAPPALLRAALATEPALWQAGECLGLLRHGPALQDRPAIAARPVVAPFARFLPSFDLAPARAAAELIGAPSVPPMPFSGHSVGRSRAKA